MQALRRARTQVGSRVMWTMPRRTLQIVAVLLLACAIGGFIIGVRSAPAPPRLPGEDPDLAPGAPIAATEAKPLADTVEAPKPPPPEPEPKPEAEETPQPAETPPAPAAAPAPAQPAKPAAPEPDRLGDLLDGVTPPPEAPIY